MLGNAWISWITAGQQPQPGAKKLKQTQIEAQKGLRVQRSTMFANFMHSEIAIMTLWKHLKYTLSEHARSSENLFNFDQGAFDAEDKIKFRERKYYMTELRKPLHQYELTMQGVSNYCLVLEFVCLNTVNCYTLTMIDFEDTFEGLWKAVFYSVHMSTSNTNSKMMNVDKWSLFACDILRFLNTLFRLRKF